MSLAERTRAAVRREPFLLDALRAGVVNYSAAARHLDVDGDPESIATALRRFAADLDSEPAEDRTVSVRLNRGVSVATDPDGDAQLTVGSAAIVDGGDRTAIDATGAVGPRSLERVLGRLRAAGVSIVAAGASAGPTSERDGELLVVVGGRDGARALRIVEGTVESP